MIETVPVGNTDRVTLEALRQPLEGVVSQRTRIGDIIGLPREGSDQRCGQHLTSMLLARLPSPPRIGDRVMLRGWYILGSSNGTVIVVHGGKQNRADATMQLLELCCDLSKRGFNVL